MNLLAKTIALSLTTLALAAHAQVVKIDKPVATSFVKVKVKGIYSGSTFNDTVISELIIYDNSPSETVAVSAVKASTVYPADADGNYEPKNVEDGVLDSMWCEGDKGDGTNQSAASCS